MYANIQIIPLNIADNTNEEQLKRLIRTRITQLSSKRHIKVFYWSSINLFSAKKNI